MIGNSCGTVGGSATASNRAPESTAASAATRRKRANSALNSVLEDATLDDNVAKVSVIGVGMRSNTGVAQTMFKALAERGVNIQVISTSEIKISVLIDAAYTELAVRALHAAYGLDKI